MDNNKKAFLFLEKATQRKEYDELQAAGLVQSFEFKLGCINYKTKFILFYFIILKATH